MDFNAIITGLRDHALTLGVFERVNGHEPKMAPGGNLSAAFWVERVAPLRGRSGLTATTALVTMNCRVYTSMVREPQDAIDPDLMNALDLLMNEYSGDFELNGAVCNVDLLGQFGNGLQARAGYVKQDNRLYRVMTLDIPLVINDAWTQGA